MISNTNAFVVIFQTSLGEFQQKKFSSIITSKKIFFFFLINRSVEGILIFCFYRIVYYFWSSKYISNFNFTSIHKSIILFYHTKQISEIETMDYELLKTFFFYFELWKDCSKEFTKVLTDKKMLIISRNFE